MAGALTIQRLMQKSKDVLASDIHIKIGVPPVLRIASKLHRIDAPNLTPEDTKLLLMPIVPEHLHAQLADQGNVDFSYHTEEGDRFRCSVFSACGGLNAAIRRVNPKVPSFEDLHLPPIYRKMTEATFDGLVVVCGVTGSGKSSTLAAMLQNINEHRQCNIVTVEDPVEYAFRPAKSIISQREIGIDVPNFPTALRCAVRQDPDVIMIGELRDHETVMAGIQAAETGHLVFATLHTSDTMQAFNRMLEFFPTKDHNFVRSSLSASLRAVMAQRLLPSIRPEVHRVPATEVLLNNGIVSDRIREGGDEDFPAIIAGSGEEGMHDFTTSLWRLVEEEWVDLKTAEQFAPNVEALQAKVRGIEVKADLLVSKIKK
ncbi:MAG: type IV pilus twitching motility protein PilT [Pirellulales bacterium]